MSKILIVEDDPESRYMLERLLASRGHHIISAENGEDALRLARQDPPEVIISDIMMPVMNGFRLCHEVKKDSSLRNIPFIFYTATFTEKTDEKLAMSLGASRFILKPTEGEQFIHILDEVLDEHWRGTLQVPEKPLEGEDVLLEMYDNSIARKLSKTVEKLQNEQKVLIKSQRRLKEAQELSHIGHWELNLKDKSLEWSDEIYRILELKPQEFDASHEAFMAAVHPDDRTFVTQAYQDSLVKKTQYDIEYRLLLEGGTLKYINERFQTIYDDDGMPTCSMGTIQDITERNRADEALRDSEMRFRELFDNMSSGVAVYEAVDGGRDFVFKDFNKGGERIENIHRDETIGRRVTEVFPGVRDFGLLDVFRRVWKTGVPEHFPVKFYLDDRTWGWRENFVYKLPSGEVVAMYDDVTERKEAEGALREAYDIINKSSSVAFTWKNQEGWPVEFVSENVERLFGYTAKEFIKGEVNYAGCIHPEDLERVAKEVAEFSTKAETAEFTHEPYRIIAKDGSQKIIDDWTYIVRDNDGRITHYKGVVEDITERKRAEERIRFLSSSVEQSSEGMAIADMEGSLMHVNQAWAEMHGYESPEELTGRHLSIFHTPEQLKNEVEPFNKMVMENGYHKGEVGHIRKDCTLFPTLMTTTLLKDESGKPIALSGIAKDITDIKSAEEALRQSEYELSIRNRINEIFLTIPDEEMYGEVLNLVLEIVESKYGIFGYINEDGAWVCPSMTRGVWDECRITDKTIIFTRDQWGGLWGRAMAEKKTICSNNAFTIPQGHIPIVRSLDVPIIYQGELIGNLLVGDKEADYSRKDIQILEDIADNLATVLYSRLKIEKQEKEKKQLEAQFHHAQKMEAIGVLAGGVAHDFNNLLTTIIGNAQFVLDDLPKDGPLCEDIQEIIRAGQRGAVLTRQLLTFGRREALHPEILDLNEVVHDMDKLLRRLLRENIELRTVLSPGLWKVQADPGQMEQVIMNLVINARDVMLEGGKLTIETVNVELDGAYIRAHFVEGSAGSYVMLSVTDTGPGMDEETMSRMFEPFFTTKEKGTGTGLGLSMVYGIVKQSKGYIWPYSELGTGTTMKVYLPRAEGVQAAVPEKGTPEEEVGGNEVVLVVEDEESLRKLAVKSLQKAGYEVLAAANGEEALRVSEEFKRGIHLLLTDVMMPVMGGRELAERMMILRPGIKVVYMSGYPDSALSHNDILESGMNYFQKPFTSESLCRKVREALDRQID